jgi:hypothetical protein
MARKCVNFKADVNLVGGKRHEEPLLDIQLLSPFLMRALAPAMKRKQTLLMIRSKLNLVLIYDAAYVKSSGRNMVKQTGSYWQL